jgi:hypothetical protein
MIAINGQSADAVSPMSRNISSMIAATQLS